MLGEVGKGFYQIMWELQGERLNGCAGNIAAAQRAFDLTLEYAKTRSTFGKPIGRHQALRHRLAEMAVKLEAGRELTYATARRMVAGEYPVREVSMTKVFTCRVANEVVDDCIQIHGGAGYMKEYGDRAAVARHPAEPDRRRNRRDHARHRGEVVRALDPALTFRIDGLLRLHRPADRQHPSLAPGLRREPARLPAR